MGMQTLERGQEGGVDIEMTVPPVPHEAFGMEPLEALIAEQLYACFSQRRVEGGIEILAGAKILMVDGERWNEACLGAQQSLGARYIRHDEDDLGGKGGSPAGFDQRLQIAAPARDEDGDVFPRHRAPHAGVSL